MPRSIDPDQYFKVSLAGDLAKPEAERPRFIFKPFTVRGWRVLVAQIDSMSSLDAAEAGVKAALVGWENLVGLTFSTDAIGDVLTPLEIVELFAKVCDDTTIGDADKKKSDSPPSSITASSPKDATAPVAESARPQSDRPVSNAVCATDSAATIATAAGMTC
jgi:hypothetical protein